MAGCGNAASNLCDQKDVHRLGERVYNLPAEACAILIRGAFPGFPFCSEGLGRFLLVLAMNSEVSEQE